MLPLKPSIGRAAFIACLLSNSSVAITAQAAPLTGTTVVDAKGVLVGIIDVCRGDLGTCLVHSQINGTWYSLVARTGEINGTGVILYFASNDCTGIPYGLRPPGTLVNPAVIGASTFGQSYATFEIWAPSVPARITVSSYFTLKKKCVAVQSQPTGTLYQFSKITTLRVDLPLTIQ